MRTRSLLPVVMAAVLMAACGPTSPTGRPPDARSVAGAITEAGLRARLESLAAATGTSAPYRAVGSAGYDAAADLVVGELRAAGWAVTDDAVTDASFVDEGGSLLDVGGRSFGAADLLPLIFAPAGEVEGPVVSIVGDPAAADASAKGCAVTHYGRLPRRRSWWCRAGHACAGTRSSPQQAGAAAFIAVNPRQAPASSTGQPSSSRGSWRSRRRPSRGRRPRRSRRRRPVAPPPGA